METNKLKPGNSYDFQITAKDDQGNVVNWNWISDFLFKIYSKNGKILKTFEKSDLTITTPSSGIAIANLTGEDTQGPELNIMYIVEYKYKVFDDETSATAEWGIFLKNYTNKEHFE